MIPFFKELFEYSHHFNQKLADVFIQHPDKTSEKSLQLYNHILNAHQIWNTRIDPVKAAFGVWDLHPVSELKGIDQANFKRSLEILDHADLNATVQYANSRGQVFSNTVRDMLFHIINHSTYHRGQIATEFKLHGLEPLATDYIFFKR
jgi:uncharacterized damage-inducible protein DinB